MHRTRIWRITAAIAFVAVLSQFASETVFAARILEQEEVQDLITGKTEVWSKGGIYFSPDGLFLIRWERRNTTGKWWVENRNDRGVVCWHPKETAGFTAPYKKKVCDQRYVDTGGGKVYGEWKGKRNSSPFKFLEGNQMVSLGTPSKLKKLFDAMASNSNKTQTARQEDSAKIWCRTSTAHEGRFVHEVTESRCKKMGGISSGGMSLAESNKETRLEVLRQGWDTKDTAQKQAAKEQHAQQLAASRSRLFDGILKVRTLMQENPDYPQKAGVNEILNLAITRLALNDLVPLEETEAMLAGVVHDVGIYEERQAEKAQRKALAIAKAKKQAEEEKQRQLKLAQAEAEKQKQAELAALEKTKASTTELPPLEPMDKVFVVQQTTNIRTEPKVLAARAGRVASGDTLTILAKVSGQDWYLVETDNGERGFVFAKALASTSDQQGSATETPKSPAAPKIDFGKYYALVIGNNTYRALPDLQSAVNDARAVGALLESDYGFEVELLTNATRSETYSSLARIRRKVAAKDNLLIYYAGHGWLDKEADEGYWMPIDAEEEDAANWISSGDIIAAVRRSKAKHVMVVADSCFSGTLTRGLTIKSRTPDYLERMAKKRARTALTSGGLEPVMDSGGGNHSVFAQAFLSVLKENDAVLDGHQLFTVVRKKVMVGSEQTPEYGDLRKAGHDGGDFLFVKR